MRIARLLVLCLLLLAATSWAQQPRPHFDAFNLTGIADLTLAASNHASAISPAKPTATEAATSKSFQWRKAIEQSFQFLAIEHAIRLTQPKTRHELGGKFFDEWFYSASCLHGWGDGDGIFTNYFGHPMQGAGAGFIQIQNDPQGVNLELGDPGYWKSRTKAMAWAALYSTQFELGPVSEASIGHVGKQWGTAGYVDLIMTPLGGMAMIVAEDAADRFWVKPLEGKTQNLALRRFYRIAFNPARSFANVMRGRVPWHRDTRPLRDPVALHPEAPSAPAAAASSE